MKGGFSETRIEKRIIITGDEDVDQDQVCGWEQGSQWHCPVATGPPALGYLWTAMCVSREGVHFLLTLSRGEAPKEGALNGRQKEPEDLSSSLSLDLAGASLCTGGACWSLQP